MKTSILLALLLPSFLLAAPATPSARNSEGTLAAAASGWRAIPSVEFEMEPFPEEGSPEFEKDFELLLKYQEERTPEQCRQGRRMKWPHFSTLFKTEILDPEEMALVTPLMNQVKSFTERVANYHKGKFERPRPYDTNPKVKPCVEKTAGSKAYPSSHAAIASAISCALIEIYPGKEEDLKAFGKELGDLRAVIGVHHPSDVKAGEKLGQEICDRLMSEPDFKEEIRELKKAASFTPN